MPLKLFTNLVRFVITFKSYFKKKPLSKNVPISSKPKRGSGRLDPSFGLEEIGTFFISKHQRKYDFKKKPLSKNI